MIEIKHVGHHNGYAQDFLDYEDLVSQLSPNASIKKVTDPFIRRFLRNKEIYIAWENNTAIGTYSILLEEKINRGLISKTITQKVAHIEEVVVSQHYRGMGIGKMMMEHAINRCKELGCYKIILDCSRDNVPFYEKCGFKEHEVCMRVDL